MIQVSYILLFTKFPDYLYGSKKSTHPIARHIYILIQNRMVLIYSINSNNKKQAQNQEKKKENNHV